MRDLIEKKRDGGELSKGEIEFMVDGYTNGSVPDYQMSAMLMAIYFNGMSGRETLDLTMAMVNSGTTLDLSGISGIKADKHSTGGVGDKTSLVLCPMLAALGVKMAKMSGRGLGHTGGTLDKLESFRGFSSDLSAERFFEIVEEVGFVIAGQTANLAPADKKIYALRDVTGTVGSKPLIVSSIMSKKLAAGADVIVLDVKMGSGAFMKTEEDAFDLARQMVEVGELAGRQVAAVITDMDEPLGNSIGNALEVKEAIEVLGGQQAGHLKELCLKLGASILMACGMASDEPSACKMLEKTVEDGSALGKFADFVAAQGGDSAAVYDTALLPAAKVVTSAPSPVSGYVTAIAADKVGEVCLHLGGGRSTKESAIDLSVGLVLHKKCGDYVEAGESLADIHAASVDAAAAAGKMLAECYTILPEKPALKPFILGEEHARRS